MEKKSGTVGKNILYRYEHMGIKNKTLILVSLVIINSLLLFSYVFISVFNTKNLKDNVEYTREILKNTTTSLDTYFDEIASIANEANYEYYLQNYLIAQRGSDSIYTSLSGINGMNDYEMSSRLFGYTLNSRSDVSSIMIFGKSGLLLHKSIYSYRYLITDYTDLPWYQEAVRNPQKAIVTGPNQHDFLRGNTDKTISLSRAISSFEDGSLLGIILVDLNLNEITEICSRVYKETGQNLYIVNGDGQLIYGQRGDGESGQVLEGSNLESLNKKVKETRENSFLIELHGENYQVVYSNMERTDWNIVSMTPYHTLTASMYQSLFFILTVTGVLFLIIIVVLNGILTRVIKPISVLKEHMDLADAGNLHVRAEITRKDETGMLAGSFNNMLDRIEMLMEQVVSEQEGKRKYELDALQAQINPHFLYNTLDSIIWMAETRDSNVVPMTEALAKLFRISLNKGNEMIWVKDELEHVRNYLIIQSMRYTDKFDYDIVMEDGAGYCRTIKLIVQPIVENSVYHGIKKKKGRGYIRVKAYKKDSNLIIQVFDNGNGMNEELCKEILEKESTPENTKGSGIGVKNVNQRIKLYFGDGFGVTYTSILGESTTATITLPILEDTIL